MAYKPTDWDDENLYVETPLYSSPQLEKGIKDDSMIEKFMISFQI